MKKVDFSSKKNALIKKVSCVMILSDCGNDLGAFRQRGLYDSGLMGGPPMTAINLRNLTAFHEAGHCVVAKFFGFVLSVNILPDLAQDRLGICMARTAAWERERRSYLMFLRCRTNR